MDLDELKHKLSTNLTRFLGYPCSTAYKFPISNIFDYHINNVGAPLFGEKQKGTYKAHTKDIEKWVIEYFADLWEIDKDSVWGYITNSGTEGNLQGLFLGRESFDSDPVFYTSSASHYSIFKIARMLRLRLCIIETYENGEMNYEAFEEELQKNLDSKVLINLNFGSTMTGAYDNPRKIYRILEKYNKHEKKDVYIHADAALYGACIPYLEMDIYFKRYLNSLSFSGHKFFSISFPCGIFLAEKPYMSLISNHIPYIACDDATISGSRNGHSAIYFKWILTQKTHDDFKKDIHQCIDNAEYLCQNIKHAWRNQNSFIVVFPKPSQEIIEKYQLATQGDIAHIVCMQHVTKDKLDEFIKDYNDQSMSS